MASVCFPNICLYGLMNPDQIPKINLEGMVTHCELCVGSYLCVESVYLLSSPKALELIDGSVDGDTFFDCRREK